MHYICIKIILHVKSLVGQYSSFKQERCIFLLGSVPSTCYIEYSVSFTDVICEVLEKINALRKMNSLGTNGIITNCTWLILPTQRKGGNLEQSVWLLPDEEILLEIAACSE